MKSKVKKLSAIDLFSGCGGLTVGLKQAGFRVLAAIEIDRKAQETYAANHRDVSLIRQDIRKVSGKELLKKLNLKFGELDLLAGCPPCQGFSMMRTRNQKSSVSDHRNDLIHEFSRLIEALSPKTIMLENVPGLSADVRFSQFCRKLKRLGYKHSFGVHDAADYGLPQRRKRLLLLASKVDVPILPQPDSIRSTVRATFHNLPKAGLSGDPLHDLPERRSAHVQEIIRNIPQDGGSRAQLPQELMLECHKRSDGFRDVYGRMSWDDVAPTITGGCFNPSKGRFLHPEEDRCITLREASLLQGFPSKYRFDVTHGKESIALMIGNALPPPFIKAHACALNRHLKKQLEAASN